MPHSPQTTVTAPKSDHEHTSPAEPIAEAAADDEADRCRQRVARSDQLRIAERRPEAGPDTGNGDEHYEAVEARYETPGEKYHQAQPPSKGH
jgi:hypothetical protein